MEYRYKEGQVVRYRDSGRFDIIAKVDYDGTVYVGAGNGSFLGACISEVSRERIRPLTKEERGPFGNPKA